MSLNDGQQGVSSGRMLGSMMDGLEEPSSCFVESAGGFVIAHGGGDRGEVFEGYAGLKKVLGRRQ